MGIAEMMADAARGAVYAREERKVGDRTVRLATVDEDVLNAALIVCSAVAGDERYDMLLNLKGALELPEHCRDRSVGKFVYTPARDLAMHVIRSMRPLTARVLGEQEAMGAVVDGREVAPWPEAWEEYELRAAMRRAREAAESRESQAE